MSHPTTPSHFALLFLAWTVIILVENSHGQTQPEKSLAASHFEAKIRPLLTEHCLDCHSVSGSIESGLRLDSKVGWSMGGDRGPAIIPGDPQSSLLFEAISHADPDLQMPPDADKLSERAINDVRKWIEEGAYDPREEEVSQARLELNKADRLKHWAFQPIVDPAVPTVRQRKWPATELDHFVLRKLESAELQPSEDAAPAVLLRRIYFGLVGLPPSLEDIEQFYDIQSARGLNVALCATVDSLLASEQFGERWGRHWLDVARFAESSGNEANISFPYAWRYRDYVIDCFNNDVPFDRFILEQLAGDLLSTEVPNERARRLIATGFLAVGPKNLDEANKKQFNADLVDEQINAVSRAFMANSIACARCHDHKTDPYSMEDYYALAGIFQSTQTYFGTAVSPANRVGGDPLQLPLSSDTPVLHKSIGPNKAEQLRKRLADLQEERRTLLQEGKLTLRDALRIIWQSGGVEGNLEKFDEQGQALPLAMGVLENEVTDAHLFLRGDVNRAGKLVARGLPLFSSASTKVALPGQQSGRLELAQWLTAPEHPLTARVIVNRVWGHLFGTGLVSTVDDFGTTGAKPSHPELLDYLATRFVRQDWSMKRLIREIVLSRTFRQASHFDEHAFENDPENRLLWRMAKRRLEAECIRDACLATSGEIDMQRPVGSLVGTLIGDRPISLIGLNKKLPRDLDGAKHRSVYLPVIRDRLPDVLDVFDFAEPSLVTGNRETTNVPTQALYMLNSDFIYDRSQAFAERLRQQEGGLQAKIRTAFQLCFCREPSEHELRISSDFLADNEERWVDFCQSLFCAAEFRILD